jgi:hypothetical protein
MIFEMLRWWYATGWPQAGKRITSWVARVEHAFSLTLLVQTLFSPWRRIVTLPGKGLDAKMRAIGDNLVSRCIGFVIRFTVIITAGIAVLFAFISGVIVAVIWPLLPLAVIIFTVKAILG